ncbi:MAG: FecR family protein [Dissulfurispiraceae bacterium]|jgi:hypothetical protein
MTTMIPSKLAKLLFSIICIAVMLPSLALAQVAGKLTKVSGTVDILRTGTTTAVPAKVNDEVSIGDIIRTKSDGTAEITFIDNSIMPLGPRSRLGIEEYLYSSKDNKRVASLKLYRGRAGFTVPKPVYAAAGSKFEMHTRTAVAGVRGTKGLLLSGLTERVYVEEGVVGFWNCPGVEFSKCPGRVIVTAGNVGEILYGGAPIVRPFSGNEFKQQQEGVKAAAPAEKQGAAGTSSTGTTGTTGTTATTEAAAPEAAAPAPAPTPAPAPPTTMIMSAQPVITPTITTPITVTEATGTITQPKTTPVTINPNFPGNTTINVR